MDLMHNALFRILDGQEQGLYRVVLDEVQLGTTVVVRLDPSDASERRSGGRKPLVKTKLPRKKPSPPLVGGLIWMDRQHLLQLDEQTLLIEISIEPESFDLAEHHQALYEHRKAVMKPFLSYDHFRQQVLSHRSIAGLVKEVRDQSSVSKSVVYKLFSRLCRFGFVESSLRPNLHLCGAPNVPRPCDPGGRQKAGAKTIKQRVARAYGENLPPEQPGMSSEWRNYILTADRGIPCPKPDMPDRCRQIANSAFVRHFRSDGGRLDPVPPKFGEYPNQRQIQRVLEADIPRLQRLLEKTTKGHFNRSLRGLLARNWQGVSGPGHTWAIDSTIGDVYLRSSVNRAWIIGRPVVYIIVDVWSTAIVGFYVCLAGPSWDMAKLALFCAAAPQELIGELWGYQPILSLFPAPTMCAVLMCDRGEYLSKAASITGARLIPCMSYAPPYRPDLKGLVEVLHRIEKDRQYLFIPGAIDQRRKEYELRRFNPNDAVLTVREYTHYLYTIFSEYNLTANREKRLDAHMKAAGVFPSPAGLWRWGHEMGIGVRRSIPLSELITQLLPVGDARVSRQGVMFAGKHYISDQIAQQQWTTLARNDRGWDIQANHFPGSVSRIWTPNVGAHGLLDLHLSDQSTASPELTFDEVADAFAYAKLSNAEVQHEKMLFALQSLHRVEEIVANAKVLTAEAIDRYSGPKLSLTESRKLESSSAPPTPAKPAASIPYNDEASTAYLEMMRSVLSAANKEGGGNE